MDFSSSDSPEVGLGAGEGVSGRLAAAESAGGVLGVANGEGEDGSGVPRGSRQGYSLSAELGAGVGRGLGVGGDLLELDQL